MNFSKTVYAIQDFKAENEDELNFYSGEAIVIIQKDDGFDDGWWKGINSKGEIGLFPMNYITDLPCQQPTPSYSQKSCTSSESSKPPVSKAQLKKSVIRSLSLEELKFTLPELWDVDQVEIWLHAIDFGSVAAIFKAQEITGDVLLELSMASLKELNVPTFGQRFKLYTAIHVLLEEYSSINLKKKSHFERVNQAQQERPKESITNNSSKNTDDSQMKGWLYKQSYKYKTWNKRWFVLKGCNLFYFKSPKDVRMKGIINLRGYRIIHDSSIQPGKYSFRAHHEEERTFCFYTDEESQMRSWMTNLMKATITRDMSVPVFSSRVIPSVSLDIARKMSPRPPSVLLYKKSDTVLVEESIDSGFDGSEHSIELYDEKDLDSWGKSEFIEWVNAICPEKAITDLGQLKNDNLLVSLLQELSGKKVSDGQDGSVSIAFAFMQKEGIACVYDLFCPEGCVS